MFNNNNKLVPAIYDLKDSWVKIVSAAVQNSFLKLSHTSQNVPRIIRIRMLILQRAGPSLGVGRPQAVLFFPVNGSIHNRHTDLAHLKSIKNVTRK
jgi:hypothetical protein